jgi:hypothetical protein
MAKLADEKLPSLKNLDSGYIGLRQGSFISPRQMTTRRSIPSSIFRTMIGWQ